LQRKGEQQDADADLQDPRVEVRQQQRADRHADQSGHDEREDALGFDGAPDCRQGLQLRHHRAQHESEAATEGDTA
jgi:hypothetical protein